MFHIWRVDLHLENVVRIYSEKFLQYAILRKLSLILLVASFYLCSIGGFT